LLRAFKLAKGKSYSSLLDLKVDCLHISWQSRNFVVEARVNFLYCVIDWI
jgi:hypothetical protein